MVRIQHNFNYFYFVNYHLYFLDLKYNCLFEFNYNLNFFYLCFLNCLSKKIFILWIK